MPKSIEQIVDLVCECLEVDFNKLTKRDTPCQDCIDARHIIIYFTKELTELTHAQIALYFGRKLANGKGDHAASIYAHKLTPNLIKVDKNFRAKYLKVKDKIDNLAQ